MTRSLLLFLVALIFAFNAKGQIEIKSNIPPVRLGAQCPAVGIVYEVWYLPNCSGAYQWSVDGGEIFGSTTSSTVNITWDDEPGTVGVVSVTYTCGSNVYSDDLSENILSIKDQEWDSFNQNIAVDFCTPPQVLITVPHMYVESTGTDEVVYQWTLPEGWTTSGSTTTNVNFITIHPTACAVAGHVTVQGVGVQGFNCTNGGHSEPATITLSATVPSVAISAAGGFNQSQPCVTNPVVFTAYLNNSQACFSSYTYTFPSGWSWWNGSQYVGGPAVTSSNTVQLQPSGNSNDAGNVTVAASFTCGSTFTSNPYVITYATTSVTGGQNPLCTTGTFSVGNPGGVGITWGSSNTNVLTINSSGVATRVGQAAGSVTVTATFACGATATPKTIWVGWPDPGNNALVYEYFNPGLNPISLNSGAAYQFAMSPVAGASLYTWQIPKFSGWQFWIYGAQANPNIIIVGNIGTWQLICKPSNVCGFAGARFLTVNAVQGGGDGGPGIPLSIPDNANAEEKEAFAKLLAKSGDAYGLPELRELSVSPNPAVTSVTISLPSVAEEDTGVRFIDLNGKVVTADVIPAGKLEKKISIEGFLPGIYMVHVNDGQNVGYKKLVVAR